MTTSAALLLALLAGAPAVRADAAAAPGGRADDEAEQRPMSLLGAESLRGGSAALAWAGFATIGASYGQGLTLRDDLGVAVDLDWGSTELTLGAFWRRPLTTVGAWTVGGRLQLSWYLDFGSTWMHYDNLADRGLQIAPSVVFSRRTGDGLLSLSGRFPVTITRWRGGGFIVGPEIAGSYETWLYGGLSLGVCGALSWRGGGGESPVQAGRVESHLLVLVGYQVF
jgi:hypothetical protein